MTLLTHETNIVLVFEIDDQKDAQSLKVPAICLQQEIDADSCISRISRIYAYLLQIIKMPNQG